MGENQLASGIIAIGLGLVTGVLLFVPFVAASYRRRGRLTLGRALLWAALVVYFWAIWTYTLLPLPDPETVRCAGVNLQPFGFVHDIQESLSRSGGGLRNAVTDTAVLQVAFNVLLFAPLGFFIRALGSRGVLVAGLTGLGVSALIEFTQLTGVWGLYPCAYRVFDVDDLMANTLGAVVGSLVALPFFRRREAAATAVAQPVTKPRRLLGMFCDWLGFTLLSTSITVGIRAFLLYVMDDRQAMLDEHYSVGIGAGVTFLLWLMVTLVSGRTVGDHAVQLEYDGGALPRWAARLLRFLGGIGGYALLSYFGFFEALFVLATLGALVFTERGRGLPGLLSGQRVRDAREDKTPLASASR
ncbi:VanZ family protein [Arthrobacter sp. NPDC090010]|uniref:VanZ family protein n=1 Tax=Arthrobacter sp. NPDC090010 TaxID=3363942 RepID=UPI00381850EC